MRDDKGFDTLDAWVMRWQGELRALARGDGEAARSSVGGDDGVFQVLAEAYQVVGALLSDVGAFDTDHAQKILDNLSQQKLVHDDVLPWPSFGTEHTVELEQNAGRYLYLRNTPHYADNVYEQLGKSDAPPEDRDAAIDAAIAAAPDGGEAHD